MSAPTSANPHMNDPHTETSRRRLRVSGTGAVARGSATVGLRPPEQGQPVAGQGEIAEDHEAGHPAESVVDDAGAQLPRLSPAGLGVVDGCPVDQAEVAPGSEPAHQAGADRLELRTVHIVEQLRAEHEVERPVKLPGANVQPPYLDPGLAGESPAGPTDRQRREVHRDDPAAPVQETGGEAPLAAAHLEGAGIAPALEHLDGRPRALTLVRGGREAPG